MTHEYPKALYKGNKSKYITKIAEDANQEQSLRDDQFVDFAELTEPQIEKPKDANSDLKQELLEALKAKKELQEQLATAQGEFITFQNDIEAMKARIAELQGDTTPVGATNENPNPKSNQSTGDAQGVDYSDWSADQLREELNNRGIKFKVRDSIPVLIALLTGE